MMPVFNVGDKVSRNRTSCIGTVVKITDKRKDVVVDYGSFKETYREDGMLRGCDVWNVIYIVPLTKELQQKIEDEKMVRKCKALLDRAKRKVSTDNAKRIIEFLTNEILG